MSYDENQELEFGVHTKPGSKTRYLNTGSSHTMACKKAVPRGISIHLAGLTSRKAEHENRSLSDLYPKIHTALKKAGYLRNNKLTKLGEILDKRDMDMAEYSIQQEEWSKDKRSVSAMESFSGHWRTPLHKTLQMLKENTKLAGFDHE